MGMRHCTCRIDGRQVSRWLVGVCSAWALSVPLPSAHADDWPQWLGPQRDGVWRENGIVSQFPKDGPKVRWRTPIEGGYAGPAVAQGRVYITDRVLAQGAKNPGNPFAKTSVPGKERVLCLDEATGKVLWTHDYDCDYRVSYPAGPRTTPVVDGDRVYTLGSMGDLLCLETATGNVRWSKNFVKDYKAETPMWGFSASPLLDGDKLICMVGGKDSVAVAFNKDTGAEIWRALSSRQLGYAPPIIYEFGGKRQLIIWHPQAVNGLDPETGKVYWTVPSVVNSEMSIATPRKADDLLLVSSFYSGSLMLRVGSDATPPSVVWKGQGKSEAPTKTQALHSVMATPYIENGYIYGICSHGELRCLKADTGERVWESLQATGSAKKPGGANDRWKHAFLVPHGDHVFLFNEQGDLIIARLTPKGYEEISRAHILEPTNLMAGRPVVWSHPAFANKCVFARNDKEIVCVSLAVEDNKQ
jgi:outer membrane protein assembly factor BamB